jgi:hypothetical protein
MYVYTFTGIIDSVRFRVNGQIKHSAASECGNYNDSIIIITRRLRYNNNLNSRRRCDDNNNIIHYRKKNPNF